MLNMRSVKQALPHKIDRCQTMLRRSRRANFWGYSTERTTNRWQGQGQPQRLYQRCPRLGLSRMDHRSQLGRRVLFRCPTKGQKRRRLPNVATVAQAKCLKRHNRPMRRPNLRQNVEPCLCRTRGLDRPMPRQKKATETGQTQRHKQRVEKMKTR